MTRTFQQRLGYFTPIAMHWLPFAEVSGAEGASGVTRRAAWQHRPYRRERCFEPMLAAAWSFARCPRLATATYPCSKPTRAFEPLAAMAVLRKALMQIALKLTSITGIEDGYRL